MATLTPALAHLATLSTSLLGGSSLNTFPFPFPLPFPFPFTFSFWFCLWFIFQLLFMWFSLLLFLFVFLFSLSFAFSLSVCRSFCFLSGVEIRSLRLRIRRLVRAKMLMNINATGWVSVAAHWVCNWARGVKGRYQEGETSSSLLTDLFFPSTYLIRSQILHHTSEEGVTSHRRCHICDWIAKFGINWNWEIIHCTIIYIESNRSINNCFEWKLIGI